MAHDPDIVHVHEASAAERYLPWPTQSLASWRAISPSEVSRRPGEAGRGALVRRIPR